MTFFFTLFFLSVLGQLTLIEIFPSIKILGFLPFLTLSILKLSKPRALWMAFFAGVAIDLVSMNTPIGFFALNYIFTTLLVYKYKKFFSLEKLFSIALLFWAFSLASTALHFILYNLIDLRLKLSILTFLTDLILMPLVDTLYAFLFGIIPYKIYLLVKERRVFKRIKFKIRWAIYELSRITR